MPQVFIYPHPFLHVRALGMQARISRYAQYGECLYGSGDGHEKSARTFKSKRDRHSCEAEGGEYDKKFDSWFFLGKRATEVSMVGKEEMEGTSRFIQEEIYVNYVLV